TNFTSPGITINTVTALGGTLSIASVDFDTLDGTTITFGTVPPPPPPPDGGGGGGGNETGGTGGVVVDDTTPGDTTGGSRTISNTGTTSGSAAIVQDSGNNGNVVTATLPPSTSITSEGPSTAQSGQGAVDSLVQAIEGRGSTGQSELVGNARTYLDSLASTTALDIRTIVPTTTGTSLSQPIVITGTES